MDENEGERALFMYKMCWLGLIMASVWTCALAVAMLWESARGYGYIAVTFAWAVGLYFYLSMLMYARSIRKRIYG